VACNARFQVAAGAAGVDVIAGREETGAKSADGDLCVFLQSQGQLISDRIF